MKRVKRQFAGLTDLRFPIARSLDGTSIRSLLSYRLHVRPLILHFLPDPQMLVDPNSYITFREVLIVGLGI